MSIVCPWLEGPDEMEVTSENLEEVAAWIGGGATVAEGGIQWSYVGAPFCTRYDTFIPVGWWFHRRADGGHFARESREWLEGRRT